MISEGGATHATNRISVTSPVVQIKTDTVAVESMRAHPIDTLTLLLLGASRAEVLRSFILAVIVLLLLGVSFGTRRHGGRNRCCCCLDVVGVLLLDDGLGGAAFRAQGTTGRTST